MTRDGSQAYLHGIREGRQLLKLLAPLPPEGLRAVAEREIKFCDDVGHWAGSALHVDFNNGIRDFWKNQIKKLED